LITVAEALISFSGRYLDRVRSEELS